MTDAAKLYYLEVAEKRRIARGSHNKIRGGGKTVNLPNDGLTLKEVREINGEPKIYKLDEPVHFEEFKTWPEDIQAEYVAGLQEKYSAKLTDIAHMMGVKRKEFDDWRGNRIKGASIGRKRISPEWKDFLARAREWDPIETELPSVELPGATVEKPVALEPLVKLKPEALARLTPDAGLDRLLAILPALKATGAKIKIEIEL